MLKGMCISVCIITTQLWKRVNAKNPGKGFGVMVANHWYWYERWVDVVRKHCKDNRGKYTSE